MDVWQGGLVDIGSEGSNQKIRSIKSQGTEVLVVAVIVVVWFLIIAIFILRWNRRHTQQQMHYRCIAAQNHSLPKDLVIRHNEPSPTCHVEPKMEEDAHLVSEIELEELPDAAEAFKL